MTLSDSAVGSADPIGIPRNGVMRPRVARARVNRQSSTAESATTHSDAGVALAAWLKRAGGVLSGEMHSPEIWDEDRPKLRELWLYARHGAQVPAKGWLRALSVIWGALVAVPVSTLAYYVAWLVTLPYSEDKGVPDVWGEESPALRYWWASFRACKTGMRWYVLATIPIGAVAYTAGWLAARFSRAICAVGLAVVMWKS